MLRPSRENPVFRMDQLDCLKVNFSQSCVDRRPRLGRERIVFSRHSSRLVVGSSKASFEVNQQLATGMMERSVIAVTVKRRFYCCHHGTLPDRVRGLYGPDNGQNAGQGRAIQCTTVPRNTTSIRNSCNSSVHTAYLALKSFTLVCLI